MFNQQHFNNVQDNSVPPLSHLFDLRRDDLESFERPCTNTFSVKQGLPEESQTLSLKHDNPVHNQDVFTPIDMEKCSPAWMFLEQFNSPDEVEANLPQKNLSDLFDFPPNKKFAPELENKGGNGSFNRKRWYPKHTPFPNEGLSNSFGFQHSNQTDFRPSPTIGLSNASGQHKNRSVCPSGRATKGQPNNNGIARPKKRHKKKHFHRNRRILKIIKARILSKSVNSKIQ